LFIEHQREENESVLRPLARAHGFEQGGEHGCIFTLSAAACRLAHEDRMET
jgi:hypothetical protein